MLTVPILQMGTLRHRMSVSSPGSREAEPEGELPDRALCPVGKSHRVGVEKQEGWPSVEAGASPGALGFAAVSAARADGTGALALQGWVPGSL